MNYAFFINLDKDIGRRERFCRAFEKAGLGEVKRFPALALPALGEGDPRWTHDHRFHAANCAASHLACVSAAAALGWPWVYIFEDDAWPCRNANDVLHAALKSVPDGKLIVRFGCRHNGTGEVGSHATLFLAQGYQAYIDAYKEDLPRYNADWVYSTSKQLASVTHYVPGVFIQACEWAGTWGYSVSPEGPSRWETVPPDGFPTIEEVMQNETPETALYGETI